MSRLRLAPFITLSWSALSSVVCPVPAFGVLSATKSLALISLITLLAYLTKFSFTGLAFLGAFPKEGSLIRCCALCIKSITSSSPICGSIASRHTANFSSSVALGSISTALIGVALGPSSSRLGSLVS